MPSRPLAGLLRIGPLAFLVCQACLCCLVFPLVSATADVAPADCAYRDELIARADSLGLDRDPRWLALGHYEPHLLDGRLESLADGPHFFLAASGKTDPRAELHATLAAFFDPDRTVKDGEHPQCAFRARYTWLVEQLDIDPARLAPRPCERFEEWMVGLNPGGLTLVFPEAYMNNPSSMFGHTLLRVDPATGGAEKDLLAYAVNYSAEVGQDGGVAFAFKGIFGFYEGLFSVLPYYDKLKQYGDWENRDIWEYQLELDPGQVRFLLMHVWELRGIPFVYYFFDDNCSFQLLALLEVADPSLRLTQEFPLWVIPIDTARVVAARPGLVSDVAYRPSPATRIRYESAEMSAGDRSIARAVALGEQPPDSDEVARLPRDRRAHVLSLAYTYLRYLYLADEADRESSAARSRRILAALSRVEDATPVPAAPTPAVSPDHGHAVARFDVASGVRDGSAFAELRLRPAFHSLLDPSGGYTAGAQIEVMKTALRYTPGGGGLRVEELVILDITSVAPRDRFLTPISWTTGVGMHTRLIDDGPGDDLDPHSVWYAQAGAGLSYAPRAGVLAYGLVRALAETGDGLHGNYAIGPSTEIGALASLRDDAWRVQPYARVFPAVVGDTTLSARLGVRQLFSLTRNTALVVEIAGERAYGETWLDATLSWQTYFRYPWNRS